MTKLFVLLSFLAAAPAFAFSTAQFKLQLSRENIHDVRPLAIAAGGPFQVRYEDTGTCYIVTKRADYVCKLNYGPNNLTFAMSGDDFSRFTMDELVWTQPQYRGEYYGLMVSGLTIYFVPDRSDAHPFEPSNLLIAPITYLTTDGKTEYQLN